MQAKSSKTTILDFMRSSSYAPQTAEALIETIPVSGNLDHFWKDMLELEENGEIIKTRFGTYGLPEKMGLVVGRFQLTSKGFGFVIPDNKGERPDVFIPPRALVGAMNNDRVMARVESSSGGNKPEGEIIRIITHANNKIVGIFHQSGDFGFVTPDDKRIGQDIYIMKRHFGGAKTNQKVVAEITEWPVERRNAEGKIIEILGNVGDVGLEILSIIKQNDLPLEFPPQVIEASKRVPKSIKQSELEGRRDLRDLPIVTVDGDDAKDLDDAVYVKQLGKDEFLLGVHIADVSYYVKENAVLDKEARERGTSVYLPDRVIPMLPKRLSNGICSLNEGQERLALSCIMTINEKGRVIGHQIAETVIRVDRRMTYTAVNAILTEPEAHPELLEEYHELVPMFRQMQELSALIRSCRKERGAIDFEFPESKVILDAEGTPVEIRPYPSNVATRMIEDFMLMANETVAEEYCTREIPFLYRTHDKPDGDRMEATLTLIREQGIKVEKRSHEITPGEVQKILTSIEGTPEEPLISRLLLRSMARAIYTPERSGHFGLAASYYCHFTSPIRRYPDLQIHRIIKDDLRGRLDKGGRIGKYSSILQHVAEQSSAMEQRAAEAEREAVKLKKAEYMLEHVGEEYDGVISGVTGWGFYVELPNTVEGLVHIMTLKDDYYNFDEENYRLVGEQHGRVFRLGEPVRVRVRNAEPANRTIDFTYVEKETETE